LRLFAPVRLYLYAETLNEQAVCDEGYQRQSNRSPPLGPPRRPGLRPRWQEEEDWQMKEDEQDEHLRALKCA
jgi:hypothetical protein